MGKVRAIGVSNFCQSCLEKLLAKASVVPAVNQIKYHVGMTSDPEGIISYCTQKNIMPMAYSPLSGVFGDPLLHEIGHQHKKSEAQVALRWIASKGIPLATKSTEVSHLIEDTDIFSWDLTKDEVAKMDAYKNSTDIPSWG